MINTNCKLNSLGLESNRITDKDVKYLTKVLTHTNCKLNRLGLANNKITDEGVKHLTTALVNSNCKLNSLVSEKSKILINDVAKEKICAVFFRVKCCPRK